VPIIRAMDAQYRYRVSRYLQFAIFRYNPMFPAGTFNEDFDYRGGRGIICLTSVEGSHAKLEDARCSPEAFYYAYYDYVNRLHR